MDERLAFERSGYGLRRARRQRRISVRTFARRTGVEAATIRELEAGRFDPPLDVILALADGVGVRVSQLILNITDPP